MALLLSAAGFTGCTSRDNPQGDSAAREAGRRAYEASQKAKEAADKAARKLHEVGKEASEGWREARREDRAKSGAKPDKK
jgi:hypothetical protein